MQSCSWNKKIKKRIVATIFFNENSSFPKSKVNIYETFVVTFFWKNKKSTFRYLIPQLDTITDDKNIYGSRYLNNHSLWTNINKLLK